MIKYLHLIKIVAEREYSTKISQKLLNEEVNNTQFLYNGLPVIILHG